MTPFEPPTSRPPTSRPPTSRHPNAGPPDAGAPDAGPSPAAPFSASLADLDAALTAQLLVGWAGEAGETPRLAWWRTDMASEFGGEDLFARLLPSTWRWATLQAAREAARRTDRALRARHHDADALVTLFHLDVRVDVRLDERLAALKQLGRAPAQALPGLAMVDAPFHRETFAAWAASHGKSDHKATPAGRQVAAHATLGGLVGALVANLAPLADSYPLPHVRTR